MMASDVTAGPVSFGVAGAAPLSFTVNTGVLPTLATPDPYTMPSTVSPFEMITSVNRLFAWVAM